MKEEWQRRPLGDVATLSGRIGWRGLTAKEYTREGPWFLSVHSLNHGDHVDFQEAFHISQARFDESPEIMLRRGDVLICKDGAGIGKLGIVGELPGPATINSSLLLIRAGEQLRPKFLYYCLCSPYFQQIVQSRLNGATTPHLYQRDITEFPVVIPPTAAQDRIVAILDEAVEGIATAKANAEKNLQNARQVFSLLLTAALRKRVDGWTSATIGDVCTLKSGTTIPVEIERSSGDVPYVKVAEMTLPENSGGIRTSIRFIDRADVKPAWVIPAGAVIFPKRGGAILTNKKRLALVDICADLNIMSVIPSDQLTPEFLFLFFLTVDMRKLGTGSSIPQINNYDVAPLAISFPTSITKQRELTALLEAIRDESETLASLYERKLSTLDELKKSLLHQAFSGALTDKSVNKQVAEVA